MAEELLNAGKRVRVLARHPDRVRHLAERGAEVSVTSLDDFPALERALDGAEGFYLLSPPDPTAQNFLRDRAKLLDGIVDTVRRARTNHVVFLSSLGAQFTKGTGPVVSVHHGEQALRRAGVASTFLRPSYFVENWGAVLGVAVKDGVLPSFIPGDLAVPMVSTPDIGRVAAEALLRGPIGTEIIELVGPTDPTPREVAECVGRLLGRPVTLVEPPLARIVPTFTSFGVSEDVARLYEELYGAIARRDLEPKGDGARLVRGAIPLEQTLRALLPT